MLVAIVLGKERDVLAEIKKLKKERKVHREASFHADQPRKAAIQQREKMKDLKAQSNRKSTSSSQDKKKVSDECDVL